MTGHHLWPQSLGCLFLFDRNLFWGLKNKKNRIPEDFFFSCVFRRNFSPERGFGGGRRNYCFLPLSQKISQEFLWDRNSCIYSGFLRIPPDSSGFLMIPPDSSGFLFPPNAVLLWPATTTSQRSFPAIWWETIHRQKNFPPTKDSTV